MTLLYLVICLMINISQAQETKVYVMAVDAQPQAFKAQLEVDAQSRNYVDHYLTSHPQWSKVQKLQQAFESAQKTYLTQPLQDAVSQFAKVVEQRFEEDWDQPQIKLIHYALLRMAQHDRQKDQWLQEAIRWNPELEPDQDLFPPPFIAEWKSLKQQMKMRTWDLSAFKQNDETFIVNGEWFQSQDFIMRPEGTFRITLVSNRYLPITFKGTIEDLNTKMAGRIPFVRGTCTYPDWNTQAQGQNLKVFFSPECQVALRETKKKEFDLVPTASPSSSPMSERMPTPKTASIIESKWFWIGAAVVTGFVAYNQMKPQKKGSEPSTHEGF